MQLTMPTTTAPSWPRRRRRRAADAGDVEHALGDDRAAHQVPDLDTDEGDHGDQQLRSTCTPMTAAAAVPWPARCARSRRAGSRRRWCGSAAARGQRREPSTMPGRSGCTGRRRCRRWGTSRLADPKRYWARGQHEDRDEMISVVEHQHDVVEVAGPADAGEHTGGEAEDRSRRASRPRSADGDRQAAAMMSRTGRPGSRCRGPREQVPRYLQYWTPAGRRGGTLSAAAPRRPG